MSINAQNAWDGLGYAKHGGWLGILGLLVGGYLGYPDQWKVTPASFGYNITGTNRFGWSASATVLQRPLFMPHDTGVAVRLLVPAAVAGAIIGALAGVVLVMLWPKGEGALKGPFG